MSPKPNPYVPNIPPFPTCSPPSWRPLKPYLAKGRTVRPHHGGVSFIITSIYPCFFFLPAPNKNFIKPMCTSRGNLPPLAHPNKNFIKPMCTSRGNLPPLAHASKNPFKAYLAPMAIKSPQDKRVSRGQKKKWASMILLKGPCGLLSMSLVVVKGLEVVEIISCKRIISITSSPMPFLYNPLTILPRV